ncbi:GntR family transcriptional regulator [Propylenella binzhouense]
MLELRPLYRQVREAMVSRLIDGRWQPGQMLPSEQQIALEMGVSQGTVRKALDALAADSLVVRRQGRGTFVAEPEAGRLLFKFFKLTADDGSRRLPDSILNSLAKTKSAAAARAKLKLPPRSSVWQLDRTRFLEGRPVIAETITLPVTRFAGLDRVEMVPNNVYSLYATRFGLTVGHAVERVKAVAASAADAEQLGCPEGTPLLLIDRIAYGLDEAPIEWRVSRCLTDSFHYLIDLK